MEQEVKIKGWVARDPDGELWLFKEKPYYNENFKHWGTAIGMDWVLDDITDTSPFLSLQYTDEPIEVELTIKKL